MKEIYCFFALVLVGLMVAGCAGFGRGRGQEDVLSVSTDFHRGSEGIYMRFLENTPPPIIYDTEGEIPEEIVIQLELWNRGAEDTGVAVFLGGFDQYWVHLPTRSKEDIEIAGKSLYNSEGERTVVEFPKDGYNPVGGKTDGSIKLPPGTDVYRPNLQATICYLYKTEANPVVCLSPDPYKITSPQSCVPGTVTGNIGTQGAPVAVSGLRAEVIPGAVIFKIMVTNVNKGRVLDERAFRNCPGQLSYLDLNYVRYSVSLQDQAGDCKPLDRVRLVNGQGTIFCKFGIDYSQPLTFETPLMITLDYAYMDSITQVVQIRKAYHDIP